MHAAGQRWLGRSTVVTMLAALLAIAAVLPWASPASAQAWPALAGGSSTAPSTTDPCSTGAPGLGFWNGQVCIGTTRLPDGSFQMTDPARAGLSCGAAVNSTVIDPETGEEAPIHALGPRFAQQGNAWGNGQPADATTACVDAMYAGSEEWDMLGTWLGRNGINGEGQATGIGVGARHADGSPYFNAFFLQALPQFGLNEPVVILGFLPALPTNPELPVPASTQPDPMGRQFTSMDVVAHEFGHMVFHTTPGASTNIVEDFALNEGTADIMAQLTTAFANNPMVPLTYTMGSQIDPQRPFRFMYNPQLCASNVPSTCSSDIAPDLNCYNPNLFAKFGQMPVSEELGTDGLQYTFAGPLNHWFYLLAEGSNPAGFPASPTCDGSILTGLGIKTAGQIWYQALLRKTTNWTYPAARSATLNGALQLFPGSCTVFDKVKAAWNAVSVPALADEPTCEAPTPTPTATPTPAPTATPIPVPSPFPSQPGAFPSQPGLPKTGARPFQARP